MVLADRMGCLKGGVVANVVVPTAEYVRFAIHFGFRPDRTLPRRTAFHLTFTHITRRPATLSTVAHRAATTRCSDDAANRL